MAQILDFGAAKPATRKPAPSLNMTPKDQLEHELPQTGTVCDLEYPAKPGSVAVGLSTTTDGEALFNITAPAADVAKAIADAQTSLLASFGVDTSSVDAATLEQIKGELMGSIDEATWATYVTHFVQSRFYAEALLRTRMMTFMDPDPLTEAMPVEGEDYVFQMRALMRPNVELTSYDPVKVALDPKPTVSSKDVSDYLEGMADELGTWEEDRTRGEAQAGDHVTVNIESTLDGKPFEQLTGRHVPYVVGSGVVGAELDEHLIGMKVRDRAEFTLSLPTGMADDGTMAFSCIQVKLQLDTVQHKVPARIDDAWVVANMPEAQTLLGLRSRVRTMLERDAETQWRRGNLEKCSEAIAKRLEGDVDPRYVAKMYQELMGEFQTSLAEQGISYEQYAAQPDFDAAEFESQLMADATESVRRGFALDSLADHLDIDLEEADLVKAVSQMAPGREEQMLATLLQSGGMPRMCEIALRMRANDWLLDHCIDTNAGPKLTLV